MKDFFAADKETTAETVVKKSVFITSVFPVDSAEDAEYSVNSIKKKYYDATHNCYAYIIDAKCMRFSDDGEPQGTAGLPILSVLKKKQLQRTLAVVTRYFGGVKLGAPGLVSAYSDAAANCLERADIKKYVYCSVLKLQFDYASIKSVDSVLNAHKAHAGVAETSFGEAVTYTVFAKEEKCGTIQNALIDNTNGLIEIEAAEKRYCVFDA
ncbi:MAG: YigZ family protein [Clostridiales bacterium]|jgi:uncharacterized YigZ family protein|nr:YigZ family protein [Clostridiales bacterium]